MASIEDELHHECSSNNREDDSKVDDDKEEKEEGMLLVENMEVIGEDGLLFMGLDEPFGALIVPATTSTAATDTIASTFFDDDGDVGERSHWRSPHRGLEVSREREEGEKQRERKGVRAGPNVFRSGPSLGSGQARVMVGLEPGFS